MNHSGETGLAMSSHQFTAYTPDLNDDEIEIPDEIEDILKDNNSGENPQQLNNNMEVDVTMSARQSDDRSAKRAHPEGSPKNTPEQKLIKLDIAKERNQASSTKSEVPTDEIMADAYVHDNSEGRPELRGYQMEMSDKILRGQNDLIILPTGSGKTNIASNLILKHLEQHQQHTIDNTNTKCKVLFLAPTNVLVDQQCQSIKEHLGSRWTSQCTMATGSTIENLDHLEEILTGDDYLLVVATPMTIVNYIKGFESSTMKKFSLIIFDEVHHSRAKETPYDVLMKKYVTEKLSDPESANQLPQIVGLTATVGVGDSKSRVDAESYVISLCARLGLTTPPTEVKDKENVRELELQQDPPERDIEHVKLDREDPFSKYLKQEIMTYIISSVKSKLSSAPELKSAAEEFKPKGNLLLPAFGNCVENTKKSLSAVDVDKCSADIRRQCLVSLSHLSVYHQALNFANLATCEDAWNFIEQEFKEADELRKVDCWRKYNEEWRGKLEDFCSRESEFPNPKLLALRKKVDEVLQTQRIDDRSTPRIMIFVQHRLLASMISRWLNSQSDDYKSERFVSHNTKTDLAVMRQKEAESVMLQFREGELNILVATSLLSEGIDIPECNGVIRYMFVSDVIAEVQIPGRVRAENGKVIAIVDEAKHKQILNNKPKEKWMTESLSNIRGTSEEDFKKRIFQAEQHIFRQETTCISIPRKSIGLCVKATIECKNCSREVGSLNNLYQYLTSHYLNLDPDLLKKVNQSDDDRMDISERPMDGIIEQAHLVCPGTAGKGQRSNCSKKVGKLCCMKINGERKLLAKWNIRALKFVSAESRISCTPKQYKDVTSRFLIQKVQQERLRQLVDNLPCFY